MLGSGMRFTVVTIFPEMVSPALSRGVVGNARAAGILQVDFENPRDYARDQHRSVDDSPYGGGPGMVMQVGPVIQAIEAACGDVPSRRILLSPAGRPFTQQRVRELSKQTHLILVCGRYEGIDERVAQLAIDEEVSVGDFVLSGGELAAACVIDAVARYVPGVLGEEMSLAEESFSEGLVEYPQYTRPSHFRGMGVPNVLQSGNHEQIRLWRRQQSLERTAIRRPDLWAAHEQTAEDEELLAASLVNLAERTYVALAHYPVYDRQNEVVTTSVTTLDVHDIARSVATYGLAGYFVVSPIQVQREKVEQTVAQWVEKRVSLSAGGVGSDDHRIHALKFVHTTDSLESAMSQIEAEHGQTPFVVATSAQDGSAPRGSAKDLWLRAVSHRQPVLLVFGTGWGLAREVVDCADFVLAPVRGRTAFNHLSVRSAVSVVLDRLFAAR